MKKVKMFFVSVLFIFCVIAAKNIYALSVICPDGSQPIALFTLNYDWNRDLVFRQDCLVICADHSQFLLRNNYQGFWEVYNGAGYLKFTGGCKPLYVFSLDSWYGFMLCTDGQQEDGIPGYAYLTPGCNLY